LQNHTVLNIINPNACKIQIRWRQRRGWGNCYVSAVCPVERFR